MIISHKLHFIFPLTLSNRCRKGLILISTKALRTLIETLAYITRKTTTQNRWQYCYFRYPNCQLLSRHQRPIAVMRFFRYDQQKYTSAFWSNSMYKLFHSYIVPPFLPCKSSIRVKIIHQLLTNQNGA